MRMSLFRQPQHRTLRPRPQNMALLHTKDARNDTLLPRRTIHPRVSLGDHDNNAAMQLQPKALKPCKKGDLPRAFDVAKGSDERREASNEGERVKGGGLHLRIGGRGVNDRDGDGGRVRAGGCGAAGGPGGR